MDIVKQKIEQLLAKADIRINGDRPWDITIHDEQLYWRVLKEGSIGAGEAYMDGWWDVPALDQFFTRFLRVKLNHSVIINWSMAGLILKSLLRNNQARNKAFEIGDRHYDTGNDLFRAMLDPRLVYTCGYWMNGAKNLAEAQIQKLDMVCQKAELSAGQRVLDIGCGWGSFAQYAAEHYDVEVVGLTVSEEQQKLAQQRCQELPVEIRLQDYRDIDESFDKVVSLGMFEHVGVKNYRTFMQTVARCLTEGGIFVLNTIGGNQSVQNTDPWIEKYIFPNSMIPSMRQISLAAEGLFVMEEWDNYGPHYDRTLMAWYDNLKSHWDELKKNYSNQFYRMWEYYLLCSAGSFRARKNHQWQFVLTPKGRMVNSDISKGLALQP
ncbi:MAG TPA: cyclopropane fatty acyl phospholipid synthase [Fodinibius sp.]|nr:cyclopropane fatty acyl phospholipid synthase [Fodinibius sp.]